MYIVLLMTPTGGGPLTATVGQHSSAKYGVVPRLHIAPLLLLAHTSTLLLAPSRRKQHDLHHQVRPRIRDNRPANNERSLNATATNERQSPPHQIVKHILTDIL